GNSLSDILVFGRRAGLAAAERAKGLVQGAIPEGEVQAEVSRLLTPFKAREGANPFALKEELASVMWKYVGIVRNEIDLKRGLKEVQAIGERAKGVEAKGPRAYNSSWHECVQVWNMVLG